MRYGMLPGWVLAVLPALLTPVAAQSRGDAERPPRVIEDRLRVELGAYSAGFDTDARVDASPDQQGTVFNAEDDLGLDDAQLLPQAELTLLPGTRHIIHLSSLRARRTGVKRLERDIDYEGDIYETAEIVDSSLDLYMTGITYGYQFLKGERGDLAATIGVMLGDFKTNAEVRSRVLRDPTGEVAPLPIVGVEGRIHVSSRWSFEGRFQYTTVSLDGIEGTVTDARLGAIWRLNPHVGFGLGYRLMHLEAESLEEDSAGMVDLRMAGPMLFVQASL